MSSSLLSTTNIMLCFLLGPPLLLAGFAVAFAAVCGLGFLWLFSLSLGVLLLCTKALCPWAICTSRRHSWCPCPARQQSKSKPIADAVALQLTQQARGPVLLHCQHMPALSSSGRSSSDNNSAAPGSAPELSPTSSASAHSSAMPLAGLLPSFSTAPDTRDTRSPLGTAVSSTAPASAAPLGPPQAASQHGTPVPAPAPTPAAAREIWRNDAMDGSWLANCVAERRLGQGAFGLVELVLVMPPGGAPFRAARKRMPTGIAHTTVLADEVAALRVAQGCRHAVQLLDVRSTDAHHELLFELMEGGTLEEEVTASGFLSVDRIRTVAIGCLRGLDHFHRRGICLRDIKPENLLLRTPGGEVALVDLGLAARTDSSGRLLSNEWAGTPLYAAPEVIVQAEGGKKKKQQQQPQQACRRVAPGCTQAAPAMPGKRIALTSKMDMFALGKSLQRCSGHGRVLAAMEEGGFAELQAFLEFLMEPNPAKRPTASRALQDPFLVQQQVQQLQQ